MKLLKVVCGLIYREDGKIFLARKAKGKSLAGKWEFPGGKVEEGEDPIEALKRELLEELDMEVEVHAFCCSNTHDYPAVSIQLAAYNCKLKRFGEQLKDHDDFAWVFPDQLLDYELAEADIPLAEIVAKKRS